MTLTSRLQGARGIAETRGAPKRRKAAQIVERLLRVATLVENFDPEPPESRRVRLAQLGQALRDAALDLDLNFG